VTLSGWEGNRKSNITMAMSYKRQWHSDIRVEGLERQMSGYHVI